jgi:hypothetical protein
MKFLALLLIAQTYYSIPTVHQPETTIQVQAEPQRDLTWRPRATESPRNAIAPTTTKAVRTGRTTVTTSSDGSRIRFAERTDGVWDQVGELPAAPVHVAAVPQRVTVAPPAYRPAFVAPLRQPVQRRVRFAPSFIPSFGGAACAT